MYRKGYCRELDLVNLFWDKGFAALRVAGSGSSSKPLPDIVAGNGKKYLAIEVKYTSKEVLYINFSKIEELIKFSKQFGAEAYIAVKFSHKDWLFLSPKDLKKTRSGNYRIDIDLAMLKGKLFEEIIGEEKQMKLIDDH